MTTSLMRRGAGAFGLPVVLACLAACTALNNAYETSSTWVEETWEQATAEQPEADTDADAASLAAAQQQASDAVSGAVSDAVSDAASGTAATVGGDDAQRAPARTAGHPGAGVLQSPPLVLAEVLSVDLSNYMPVPGETELAAAAEPLEVSPERVLLEQLGPNRFRISLRHEPSRFQHQRNDEWCWAACAWMVNEQNRRHDPAVLSLSQEQLAQYFKGGQEHQAANVSTIMRAITLDLEELHQRNLVTVSGDLREIGPNRLVRDLCAGSMPIVGLRSADSGGHAVIVTGLTYSLTQAGEDQRALARGAETLRDVEGSVGRGLDAFAALKGRSGKGKSGKGKAGKHSQDDDVSDTADNLLAALDKLTDAYAVEQVTLLDPWDPQALVVPMDGAAFREQLDFIVTREYARELLSQHDDEGHRTAPGQLGVEPDADGDSLLGKLFGGD